MFRNAPYASEMFLRHWYALKYSICHWYIPKCSICHWYAPKHFIRLWYASKYFICYCYVSKCSICRWYAPEHFIRHWYAPITLCSICYELICSEMSYLPLICSNHSMPHSLWIKYVLNDMIRMIWYLLRWYPWEFWYSALHYDTLLVSNRSFCSKYALSLAEPFLAHSIVI